MAKPSEQTVTMPVYMSRFRCIGSACESTCCAGWNLPVDRETYDRYQHLLDPELKRHVTKIEQPASSKEWALLELRQPEQICHFLTQDQLCGLQLRGGEQLLCATCATYPRVSIVVDSDVYQAGDLSCPEVVRLALFRPQAMKLVRRNEPACTRRQPAAEITTATAGQGDVMAFFPLIRGLSVQLLQRQEASIEARLTALGQALDELSQVLGEQTWSSGEERDRLTSAGTLTEAAIWRAFQVRASDAAPPRVASVPVELLKGLEAERFFGQGPSTRYLAQVQRILDSVAGYEEAWETLYRPYVAGRPHVLENMLVNHVYASTFPFVIGRSFFDEYLMFATRFAVTKAHIVGMAAAQGRLTDELVVDIVHMLWRALDHNSQYQNHVLDLVRRRGYTSMLTIPTLLAS